jgi:TupA-like ATPgrasp
VAGRKPGWPKRSGQCAEKALQSFAGLIRYVRHRPINRRKTGLGGLRVQASNPVSWAWHRLPLEARRRALFILTNRRLPHFINPRSFSDKINWRILNDRRPLLEWTCDKLAMKERARRVSGLLVTKTLWAGTDLRSLASAELTPHWVLKPNHRTGLVYFGDGQPDIAQLMERTEGWLSSEESDELGEWAYSKARPMLLAEELIGTPGSPPNDYKFFVFEGDVAVIQLDSDRHTFHRRRFYLPDWSALDVRSGGHTLPAIEPPPPDLDRMLAIARELGAEFDFIRVDLYNISGSIFFGEVTPYPGSGLERFIPPSLDVELLGSRWRLPDLPGARRGKALPSPDPDCTMTC